MDIQQATQNVTAQATDLPAPKVIETGFEPITGNKIISRLESLSKIFPQNSEMRQVCEHTRDIFSSSPYGLTPPDTKKVNLAINTLRKHSHNNDTVQAHVNDIRKELQNFLV